MSESRAPAPRQPLADPVADISDRFGRRLQLLREDRRWTKRRLAAESAVTVTVIDRAENRLGITLANAVLLAGALGTGMTEMTAPVDCSGCLDLPQDGFTCRRCGAGGPEAAS